MARNERRTRLLIALTEASPVSSLWQAALEHLRDAPADLAVVFLVDERWHRAASVPGTVEISRISGTALEFTRERADELCRAAAAAARRDFQRMAAEARLALTFEVLSESATTRLHDLLPDESGVVIAPVHLKRLSVYEALASLNCRVVFVDGERAD